MIGIESHITDDIVPAAGTVRVRLRIDNSEAAPSDRFADGDRLAVEVRARVYELAPIARRGVVLPESFREQGPAVTTTASTIWSEVDLVLPEMPPGTYGVVGKVINADPRYPGEFRPSNCFLREVDFGKRFLIDVESLQDVFAGTTGNPLAERAIRELVTRGEVIARDRDGALYRATSDATGELKLTSLRRQRSA